MFRKSITLLGALAVFALGYTGTANASDAEAMARPTGCKYEVWDQWGAVATCSDDNGGSWRAIARCKDPEDGDFVLAFGQWVYRGGTWSYAYCPGDTRPSSAGIETRTS